MSDREKELTLACRMIEKVASCVGIPAEVRLLVIQAILSATEPEP